MRKVYFIDEVHHYLWDTLSANNFQCIDLTSFTKEESVQHIQDAIGLVVRSKFRMDQSVLKQCPNLEFIARSGAGMENIDIPYCEGRNIELFNAPEGNRNAVAEHALGMLLSLFNKIHTADNEIRDGEWNREKNRGIELEGKTIGIIGYGNNGSNFAKILGGFDVQILTYDKYKSGFGNEAVVECGMERIFQEADVLSLHIPQTDETIGLVNETFLEKFKKPIYLINLSRGRIVSTEALAAALERKKVLGACLDVLEYEKSSFENMFDQDNEFPKAFQYLLRSNKVLLSPHVGGWTHESYYKLSKVLADKILAHYKN